jgi:hypothetical protein
MKLLMIWSAAYRFMFTHFEWQEYSTSRGRIALITTFTTVLSLLQITGPDFAAEYEEPVSVFC